MNKFLKFSAYFLGVILTIIIVFLVGLTVYDSIQMNRSESKIAQVKLGDSKEKVFQILGKPNYSWNKGDPEVSIFGGPSNRKNSGIAYGKIMDWKNAFHSVSPYFFPFKLRLFGPDVDDIVIYLDDKGLVSNIKIPN